MSNALQIAANIATIVALVVSVVALFRANRALSVFNQIQNSGILFHHIAGAQGGAGGIGGGGGGGPSCFHQPEYDNARALC